MATSTDDFNCRRDRTATVTAASATAGYRRMHEDVIFKEYRREYMQKRIKRSASF